MACWRLVIGVAAVVLLSSVFQACTAQPTTEWKQLVVTLKDDLGRIRAEIAQTKKDDERYAGGLIKALIGVRLEILKTNEALVEQRIHAIEAGVRPKIVVVASKPDEQRAAELAKEIEAQKAKVAEARREADRYSGGFVQAMAETSVASARNTLAMLEQQYIMARFGLVLPSPTAKGEAPSGGVSAGTPNTSAQLPERAKVAEPQTCLKIQDFDSSVLSTNDVFTELAWKVDVANSCSEPFSVRVRFVIYDKDEFELDSDNEDIHVAANGIGKARGKMLVSPPEKARRMARRNDLGSIGKCRDTSHISCLIWWKNKGCVPN